MTIQDLAQANAVNTEIKHLERQRADIESGNVFKRSGHNVNNEDVFAAGKQAMMAVIDEEIDSKRQELENI